MAAITLTIPDAQAPRLVADIAKVRGVDISQMNLAQKVALLKTDIQNYWISVMQQAELQAVSDAAATTAVAARIADIAANLTVT